MIYSTDYAELYRRVMAGERVLCLVDINDSDTGVAVAAEAVKQGEYSIVYANNRPVFHYTHTRGLFEKRCREFNLQFVPDNDPEKYPDTEADGIVFCGKCGKPH